MESIKSKIEDKTATIGIMGLGYVGLPFALAFAKSFNVIGYDINRKVIDDLSKGISHILDVSDEDIQRVLNKSFYPTDDYQYLKDCDFIIICVPTPLTSEKEPDLSYIKNACQTVAKILRKGHFVILESTTYPTTTEDVVIPLLEKNGLTAGEDFCIAYSPERVDPGNREYTIEKVPTVVGGINDECTEIVASLYGSIIEEVVKVRNTKTAEAVKMVENIFRNVNIGLVNELALLFEKMDIDIWEVIGAASTKPYGFMPFYPGPGIGGHCIPLDPLYTSYIAKRHDFIPRFIETSSEINEFMKVHTVNLIEKGLKKAGKKIQSANIAIMGLAYKKNIDDVRESPSIKIIEELVNIGANIRVYDPYVKSIKTMVGEFFSGDCMEDVLRGVDCAVFVVDHNRFREYDIRQIAELMGTPVIVDCKNIFDREDGIIYLGIGKRNKNDFNEEE